MNSGDITKLIKVNNEQIESAQKILQIKELRDIDIQIIINKLIIALSTNNKVLERIITEDSNKEINDKLDKITQILCTGFDLKEPEEKVI